MLLFFSFHYEICNNIIHLISLSLSSIIHYCKLARHCCEFEQFIILVMREHSRPEHVTQTLTDVVVDKRLGAEPALFSSWASFKLSL